MPFEGAAPRYALGAAVSASTAVLHATAAAVGAAAGAPLRVPPSAWAPRVSREMGRNAMLRGVAACFAVAFVSLAVQARGLYGAGGVYPVTYVVDTVQKNLPEATLGEIMQEVPSLVWLHRALGVDAASMLLLVCFAGAAVSGFAAAAPNAPAFAAAWALYASLLPFGGVFLSFQWDVLLLEAGVICVLAAPLWPRPASARAEPHAQSPLPLWAARILLFKLMLLSGVVKIQSQCPTWTNLTATTYHFATQCLPTPLARAAHHAPLFLHKAAVAGTLFLEGPAAFFLVAPHAGVRSAAAWVQIAFQLSIALTGNYTFFNWLTIAVATACLGDGRGAQGAPRLGRAGGGGTWRRALDACAYACALVALISSAAWMFELRAGGAHGGAAKPDHLTRHVELRMREDDMQSALATALPLVHALLWAIVLPGAELLRLLGALTENRRRGGGALGACARVARSVGALLVAWLLFISSSLPLLQSTRAPIPFWALPPLPPVPFSGMSHVEIAQKGSAFHLTSGYGLFRRMTGVGRDATVARPEVVFEVSNDDGATWRELEFKYKPGSVTRAPPWVAPHQPRLDWQMWFAALGSYQNNGWLVALAYRLLEGRPEVYALLDTRANEGVASAANPPQRIRVTRYTYDFAAANAPAGVWWSRTRGSAYLPELSLEDKPFFQHFSLAQQNGLLLGAADDECTSPLLCALLAAAPPARVCAVTLALSAAAGLLAAARGVALGSVWSRHRERSSPVDGSSRLAFSARGSSKKHD